MKLIEYNVDRDKSKRAEMSGKGGRGLPFLDVEGIYVRGYSPEAIRDAVEKKRRSR